MGKGAKKRQWAPYFRQVYAYDCDWHCMCIVTVKHIGKGGTWYRLRTDDTVWD